MTPRLYEECKYADDYGEEGNTFDKSRNHNHAAADVTGSFRLTGDGLHGGGANLTDTDTCTNCCDGCAESCAECRKRKFC